jgi:hypothetical protein
MWVGWERRQKSTALCRIERKRGRRAIRLGQENGTVSLASFAALLGELCGQELLTAKRAKEVAKDAKKTKLHHYQKDKEFFSWHLWKYNLNLHPVWDGTEKRAASVRIAALVD